MSNTTLRNALARDRIDVIGTDHAPHTLEEKRRVYTRAPSGLPLVQHALPAALELVSEGVLSMAQVVTKTSHAVAELFAIRERGFLREGYWADFAIVERLASPRAVADDPILAHCGWTPFQQRAFHHVVRSTVVSGQLAWHQGRVRDQCQGLPLMFDR